MAQGNGHGGARPGGGRTDGYRGAIAEVTKAIVTE